MDNEERPLISVVMACYNDAKTVSEAIKSIIDQTYPNWKLIIVNDASTDNSLEVISSFVDERMAVISNEGNKGLAISLNIGIEASKGADYIARLDSDDIALPNRLERQLSYMVEHPNVSICGANIEMFNEDDNNVIAKTKLKEDHASLMAFLPFSSPIPHSTWFVRMSAFDSFSYDSQYRSSQDYEFMYRVFESGREIACVQEVLVRYRVRRNSISHKNRGIDPNTLKVQCRVAKMLGLNDKKEYVSIIDMTDSLKKKNIGNYLMLISYCISMIRANRRAKLFKQSALIYVVIRKIYGATMTILKNHKSEE